MATFDFLVAAVICGACVLMALDAAMVSARRARRVAQWSRRINGE